MSLRPSDAITTEFCLRIPPKSIKCSELGWFLAYCTQIVRVNHLYVFCICLNIIFLGGRSVANVSSTRSKIGREEIKWNELLSHFRAVQNRHEKARRQALGNSNTDDFMPLPGFSTGNADKPPAPATVNGTGRPAVRRRTTGTVAPDPPPAPVRPPSRAFSPLNPRARGQTTLGTYVPPVPPSPTFAQGSGRGSTQPKRTLSINRKS